MKIATKTQRHKVTLKFIRNESFVPSCLCGNNSHKEGARKKIFL